MQPAETRNRTLQVGVGAAIAIVTLQFCGYILEETLGYQGWLIPVQILGGGALFVGALCGVYCGIVATIRLSGLFRLVAVLVALVSISALIQCVSVLGLALRA